MGDRPQRDLRRDAWLEARGIAVIRIAASELTRGIDDAADAIVRLALDLQTSAPAGSAEEGDHAERGGGGVQQ